MFLNIGNRLSHLFQIEEFDFLSIGFTLLCSFTSQSTFLSVFGVKADNVMMRLDLTEIFIFMVIAVFLMKDWGIREYYHLGKLTHYLADAFTFLHNRAFEGSLKEHCKYEKELHERFINMLHKRVCPDRKGEAASCFEDIEVLHERYLQRAANYENDCSYIFAVGKMLPLKADSKIWCVDTVQ